MNSTSKIWQENFGDAPCVGLDHPKFESFMDELTKDCLAETVEQLQTDNKALSLQNEILSGAYEASQKRAKHLEGLLEKCRKWFFLHAPTAVLPDTNGQEAHRYIADSYETSQRLANELEADKKALMITIENAAEWSEKQASEKAELLETLQMAWPYIHDLEADNVDDRECGLFRDNQLSELHDKVKGILQEQCPQIQDAQ
jgi:DNA repair exonuclease SbcCD ATPase subunit